MSPDASRCSYNDALGASVLRLTGKVLAEAEPGMPGRGLNNILVTVHVLDGPVRLASPGKLVGHARTTPQGDYSISAPLKPGDYLLLAKDQATETLLGYRQLTIGQEVGTLANTDILVPLDERLKNAPGQTSPP